MPHLSPTTLTAAEQRALLDASATCPRDHTIFSLALGTGLPLGEIVGLNVGDIFFPDGSWSRSSRGSRRSWPRDRPPKRSTSSTKW